MIAAFITLLVLVPCQAVTFGQTSSEPALDLKLRDLQRQYKVEVHYDFDAEKFFPAQWRKQPVSAHGKQITISEAKRLVPIIETFLSRYPKPVIQKHLQHIYLLEELRFFGKDFGATYSRSAIYIKSQGTVSGFSDRFLAGRMHSEFSSVLMKNHRFPEADWKQVNPPRFKYLGTGTEMLGQSNLYGQNPELLKRGFVVKYCQSSMENDFNMISDWLFTRPTKLGELARDYPRIATKRKLAIEFYRSIDNRFRFE